MRELPPMPTTPRAMRHFENATKSSRRILKHSHFLSHSHSLSFSQTVSLRPKAEREIGGFIAEDAEGMLLKGKGERG